MCDDYEYDFSYELRLVEAMAPRSVRSFRQEFNMHDIAAPEHSSVIHHTQSEYVKTTKNETESDGLSPSHTVTIKTSSPYESSPVANGKLNSQNVYKSTTIISNSRQNSVEKDFNGTTELKNLKRVHRMYDGPNIIESRGIVHPDTREILTVGQAISMRILDVRTGRIMISKDRRKDISIEQAARDGLIDPKLAERLVGPCGTTEDGKEVSLLEAIQRELYDAEHGIIDPAEKRIKVISEVRQVPGQGMSIAEAMNVGQVDLQKGLFRLPDGTYISVSEAYERGYLIYNEVIKIKSSAVSLFDAISHGLVEDETGWIVDRNSGDKFQLDIAIKNNLIDPEIREIVDPNIDKKITLSQAIESGIVNPKFGKYIHPITREKIKLYDAKKRGLISKPMTLKDVVDNSLIDNNGLILSPLGISKLNILEAISYGVLDSDSVKSITNTVNGELLTLSEALASRIIIPDTARFRDNLTNEICTIPEAVDRGLITSVSQKSLFDIDGFRDPVTNEFMSFNRAINNGLISSQNGGVIVINAKPTKVVPMQEGVKLGAIRPEVFEMLNRKVGIFQNSVELTVLEAVFKGILNPSTGYLLDPESQKPLPLDKAVELNLITPEGAVLLNSLLNITLTTQTVTKTVNRYVTITSPSTSRSESIVTFTEALRRGLINESTQMFTDPNSGASIPIQQALTEGLLGFDVQNTNLIESPIKTIRKDTTTSEEYVELKITKKSFVKDPTINTLKSTHTSIATDIPTGREPQNVSKVKINRSNVEPKLVKDSDVEMLDIENISQHPKSHVGDTVHNKTVVTKIISDKIVSSDVSSECISTEKQTFTLPPDGWYLSEAISLELFDPVMGIFIIPNTDRIVSFEECIKIKIINPLSAVVVDPKSGRKLSLIRSLEKGVLNKSGQYKLGNEYITMKQAIENNYIILEKKPDKDSPSHRIIQITRTTGKPYVVEVSNVLDNNPPTFTEIQSFESSSTEPVQLSSNVLYDPSTISIINTKTGKSENILSALQNETLDPCLLKIKDPQNDETITAKEAIKRGIIDEKSGCYVDKQGKSISLLEAAKLGLLTVTGVPVVAGMKVAQKIKESLSSDRSPVMESLVEHKPVLGNVSSQTKIVPSVQTRVIQKLQPDHIQSPDSEDKLFIKNEKQMTVPFDDPLKSTVDKFVEFEKTQIQAEVNKVLIDKLKKKMSEDPSKSIVLKDPSTGKEFTIEEAIEKGLLTTETTQELIKSIDSNKDANIISDNTKILTEAELTRSRVTIEPKFKVTIGSAKSMDTSPENVGKPVVLQKMRKKVISPKDAKEKGMIDDETAEILDKDSFVSPTGDSLTLSEAIDSKIVDDKKGSIIDPQRGDVLNIKEAIERGVLDPDGTNEILIPMVQSLSVPKLADQGLIEPKSSKIIHPETGDELSLREAIICDIVDPLTTLTDVTGKKTTLKQAIAEGNIDDHKSIICSQKGNMDLISAIDNDVFDKTNLNNPIENIPPAAMTLPVAIQRGLVDSDAKHIVHPITGLRTPLEDAIDGDLIMAVPYPVKENAINIKEALEKGLIDPDKGVFIHPETKKVYPIAKAVEEGLLIVKYLPEYLNFVSNEAVTTVTETVTSHHTVTTKMIEIMSGYTLVNTNEVRDLSTGEIMSIEEARKRGIIQDEKKSVVEFTTKELTNKFEDAIKEGLIDMETGTYNDPETGRTMSISDAITEGFLDTSIESPLDESKIEKPVISKTELLNLNEAYEDLYDPKTGKFKDPQNPNVKYTFKDALDKKIIDPESIIYDVNSKKQLSLTEGINSGLIDPKTGNIKDKKSGKLMDIKNAAKMGVLAVVASPVLAGMAIAKGVKTLASKSSDSSSKTSSTSSSISSKLTTPVSEISPEVPPRKKKDSKPTISPKKEITDVNRQIAELIKSERPLSEEINMQEEIIVSTSKEVVLEKPTKLFDTNEAFINKPGTLITRIESSPVKEIKIDDKKDENIIYERLPLSEAILQRKIEPKICRILINDKEIDLTVQDALNQGEIQPSDLVDIISKNYISLVPIKPDDEESILTLEKFIKFGIYDPENQIFVDPNTGAKITIIDAISQIFDPQSLFVKDLSSKMEKFYPLEEAIALPLLEKYTGHMVDPKSGKRIPFFECIKRQWIITNLYEPEIKEPQTFDEALATGTYDIDSGEYKDANTGEVYSLPEAIRLNYIDSNSLSIRDPINNQLITLSEAVELGYVDLNNGTVLDKETNREIQFEVAFLRGILSVSSRKPISLEGVVNLKLYDPESGKITDTSTSQNVSINEAVDRGIVHPTISEIKDTRANAFLTLEDALVSKLVNPDTGKLRDTEAGTLMTLDIAVKKGLVKTAPSSWSLVDVINKGYYNPTTGKILSPLSGKQLVVSDAINQDIFETDSVKIKDDQQDKLLTIDNALKSKLLDGEKGIITNPLMTLDVANEKGYLLSDKKPWSLQEGLVQGCYDPDSGLLTIDTKTKTLDEAIKKGEIDPNVMTVKNSKTSEIITLADAIKLGIIDSKLGKAKDPLKGDEITFEDASERGLIIPAKRKFSLPEAVFKGFYDPKSGKFIHPDSKEKVATDRALKKGMLDPQSTLVNIDGKVLPFEFAVDKGLVDARTGTIKVGDKEKIDFQEAFERGVLIEVRKPMSLTEAISKGIYDESTGFFMDPKTGKKYSLADAIKMSLIDADSVHIKDVRSGIWKNISLPESLEIGVINNKTGKVKDINKDGSELTIKEAFEVGLLVDSKAPISLQRAIHQGIYDEKSGKISDPMYGRKITLHEAIRKFIIDPKYLCYFDKKSEKPFTLSESCRMGVVDRRSGLFNEPNSDVSVPLNKAMELGLIVDIEGAGFPLYDALAMGFYDVEKCKFKHPITERYLTLTEAINEELIGPEMSLIKHIQQSKYIKLPDAIQMKIIDGNLGYYNLPNGNSINLIEAKLRGLIVTNHKGLSIEEAVKCGLFRPDTGKFVDPNSGDFLDLNAAIQVKFIDSDLTALKDPNTNKLKSLLSAIENGDIDVMKGRVLDTKLKRAYNFDVALDKGYLVTIVKPLTSSRSRKMSTDFTKDREPIMREFTLDEALKFEFIDPETAVVKDPQTGKFRILKLAIEDGTIDVNLKAAFDPQSGRAKSVCVIFENGLIIYYQKPLTFDQAIELKLLDVQTARYSDPQTNTVLTVKDAVVLGFIDSDTALIKDNLKKKLIKLPEAFRKGLMDAEKANILDTETSKLNTLSSALDTGLLTTPQRGFTLNESLEFGIYNPTTGGFTDPFITTSVIDRKRLTLTNTIEQGIVDPSSTVIKDPNNGEILPLLQAISKELIDPIGGRLVIDPEKDISLDFVKAKTKGYILAAETRQAIEEKYRLCDDQLNKLLDWVSDIEDRLANQEPAKEDMDELRNQINNLKQIKEEIESQQRAVGNVGEQARQLMVTGGSVLAAREIDALERGAKQLRDRADRASAKASSMLRRLQAAKDELNKFGNELSTFNSWLDVSYRRLEEQERALSELSRLNDGVAAAREFLGDVMAHQADLRFITMAGHKFLEESKDYLSILNEYRTSLPARLSHLSAPSESEVKGHVSLATRQHADLLSRAQRLQERLRSVVDTQRNYGDALDKANKWLKEVEPQYRAIVSEAVAGDPKAVENQLNRAKTLHNEMLAQSRMIDNAKDACDQLLQTLEGHLTPAEIRALEVPVIELVNRHSQMSNSLGERCGQLEAALLHSQGLQDALEGQAAWLNQAESLFKTQYRPASLIKERLDEQIREHKISSSDLVAHKPSLDQLVTTARNFQTTASNARLAAKIEQRMQDIYNRYEKLMEKSLKRAEFLEEVNSELNIFLSQATQLEQWGTRLTEKTASPELSRLSPEDYKNRLNQLVDERDSRRELLEECLRNGKQLIAKKDVTDTQSVRDRMKGLELQWKELHNSIEEKQKLSKQRSDQLNQYEKLRIIVVDWLSSTEERINRLHPVAVDIDVIKNQHDELRPINKEYRDFGHQIDKVNEVGNMYDTLVRGERPESPHRKRSSQTAYSPTKRISQSTLHGNDARSPSPSKTTTFGLVSPLSASGSSGFSSRRSSQDGFHMEEMSPVQQQLSEINNRYTLLGVRLSDRQSELDSIREEVKKHLESLKNLSLFLDKVQRQLPKDFVPNTKEEADKANKQIRTVLEEMYEKQSLLDSTKSQVKELLKRKTGAIGTDKLHDEMEDVASRWKKLHDTCKDKIRMMEDIKDFLDNHDSLASWLSSKDRMMTALGPISSDSRMVQTQVQQVQVLREELRTQQPQLSHLEEVGTAVLDRLDPKSPDHNKVNNKLINIQSRWNDLLKRLEQRAESLGAAADTSREFDAGLARLRDALQTISDNLDDLPLEKDAEEQLRKIENLERQLEGQRPLLAELEARGAALCNVLTDPTARQDIQTKLAQVVRQYNNLQKKLDHRKAEQEGALRDGRQLEETVSRTLGWIQGALSDLAGRLLVSADRDKLRQQLERHAPTYRETMAKEHEVIMLLNKGREMENKPSHPNLRKELDRIQQQWEKLRREVLDRQTKLETALEHCRKFSKAQEQFLPWMTQTEDKLSKVEPTVFKKKQIEKQLRELQQIRNDVWKKSGEYENNRTLGETFMSACDIDQDIVKDQLMVMKNRWDRLNNDLIEKLDWLENTTRQLSDFTDQARDLENSLRRCEDRLSATETLPADQRLLDTVVQIADEAAQLELPIKNLSATANDLASAARAAGGNAQHLQDEVDGLKDRLVDLNSRLDNSRGRLHNATTAVAQFNEQVKSLSQDLSDLEKELDGMKPPGRDIKTVRIQLDDVAKFYKKLEEAGNMVVAAQSSGEALVDSGFAPDTAQTREQVDTLRKKLGKLDERARNKEQDLEDALSALEAFYRAYDIVMGDITEATDLVRRLKPVGSEVEQIRQQQKELASLRRDTLEPLSEAVNKCNKSGRQLVQTAGNGVVTQPLEKDLEKMNEAFNDIKEKTTERERRLDSALLQSGRLREALSGLERWLSDTEAMVAAQRPPSADYKVVKAQLQEQKFLNKMLLDRQGSMSSLFAMGGEVAAGCEPAERRAIEQQLKELVGRFEALTDGAQRRMLDLEQAMRVAKLFQEQLQPLIEWLNVTERKVKALELVPTDEEKIQQRIRDHKVIHEDIMSKRPDFSQLTETASTLMGLVGEDEATALADRLQAAADRYQALADNSLNAGELLERSRTALRHLVLTYQELGAWMDGAERRLRRARPLPVQTDPLLRQMDDLAELTEEIASKQEAVDSTVESGLELMKHISGDEALQLKDKLDALQRRYSDLTAKGADLLRVASEALPLVQQFHNSHNKLIDWMVIAESALQCAEPREQDVIRLEEDLQHYRPLLEAINLVGPQLCQISPGEGAATIEGLVTRDNRRFDAIVEQIQRKAERLHLSKLRSREVAGDMDELLDWFREADERLRSALPPGCDPPPLRSQLKEHRAFNDDVSGQRARVRDVLSTAKKVLRESQPSEDTSIMRDKMEELRETMETVGQLSSDRLGILEQALPLAEHFADTHEDLANWLDDMERQVGMLAMPALRPEQIAQQQDKNEMLIQSLNEHKPLVDKLVKTGEALAQLCGEEDAARVHEAAEAIVARHQALRSELRHRQLALEDALQESALLADKMEGMLRALASAAEQAKNLEPVSAHPPKLEDQIDENNGIIEDLEKREEAYAAVKRAANDVINKASNKGDPAVKDIKKKLERLNSLWSDVQKSTTDRGKSLEETLELAKKFWRELTAVMDTLRELEESLAAQEPPAAQPRAIQAQQVALQEIRHEIDQTKPEVEQVRKTGSKLMNLCGEPDKPEVKKHIEDLDSAWDNITTLYAKREENLIDAMEKAMEFHDTLQNLLEFLETAEDRFNNMGPLGSDIDAVKKQITQLNKFKEDVDPHMVKVEALNRQAQELTERTSSEQAASIREPLTSVNRRWAALISGVADRQRLLEGALLRLGQFQHALQELLVWIDRSDSTLESLRPVAGDPQVLEVELAKLKVLVNDIQAHQNSVDTLNDAGHQIIQQGKGTDEASTTQDKLHLLNRKWRELQQKAKDRQLELEEALRDAQRFHAEIQDLLSWLGDVDSNIAASKPVGGLPETASEQLERFMEVFNEIERNRPKVEAVLQQGQEYLKKQDRPQSVSNLQHNLKTLKQRWDSVTARASDKKIKLEIALKEATEFHDALQAFVDWLTNAEKILSSAKPVSRVMETILSQIEEHKLFQKEVSTHRETMLHLDKKGTHLKYFSQKQDVILIKNLLVSVQHRWERVVAKAAERTRALDHGFKETREFHDQWTNLMNWLTDTERVIDDLNSEATVNDPDKIKHRLDRHREFQKSLGAKQPAYDTTMKCGKQLKDKAPKPDESTLRQMLAELKSKWTTVCSKSVDRQRKLEEALLFSGQFKDAMSALIDWLKKQESLLKEDTPVHGDLDTVMAIMEQHKQLEEALQSRSAQMESVIRTGRELEASAPPQDAAQVSSQLTTLSSLWQNVNRLCDKKTSRIQIALKEAEKLYKAVHMLLEWLSDAETKLRFAGQLPDSDEETAIQVHEHERFMMELRDKEKDKDSTLTLAHTILAKAHPDGATVIKHWITIIQSRWDEVSQWAIQRRNKLENHMQSLKDLDLILEELLQWLIGLEHTLLTLESEPLPESIELLEGLIQDHKDLMENTQKRQGEVDRVCKANQIKSTTKDSPRRISTKGVTKGQGRGSQHDLSKEREASPDYYGSLNRRQSFKGSRDLSNNRRGSRVSPGREGTPEHNLPHYGPKFPPKGSKGSEPEFRSGRVKLLWEKWRSTWLLAWERQRRLHEHLMNLRELERVRNFSWDEWRKRFLKFMNHKKSRLTDLFRKMDKDNNGLIPRDDFIDGIMNTKFDTSRLEMGAVADLFDRNNSGLIDWQEFIAALRPDWVDRRPETDADKIHDEVKRLVMMCTCRQKFRVFQVGEGKYRFGDSQKLRLVRILRSTVMVRVGGGWVALDEFLVKNDPCRVSLVLPLPDPSKPEQHEACCPLAKGRTNIELREQFILADGVSQSMAAFKSKTPRTSTNTPPTVGQAGPITKVRERSIRSVPMGGSRPSRSSLSAGTPDSLSDNEASFPQTPRSALRKPSVGRSTTTPGGSRPSSRPGSRAGSKPPSRHGSNLSLDSTDEGIPSRIPLSRRVTTPSNTARSGLSTPRTSSKLGVATNGSSRPRTPTGLVSPAGGRYGGNGLFRTSSIPTFSATGALASPAATSQPISLGLSHSKSHSHPIQSARGSKIPIYTRNVCQDKGRRSRSISPPPQHLEAHIIDQRTPEEDSSLFNISNISTASSGSCSNSSYSLSGSAPAHLLSGADGCGSVIMVETSTDDRQYGSGSYQKLSEGHTPKTTSRIPVYSKDITNNGNLTNQYRPRASSGSSTPVQPGQATAASRLFRKGSNASDTASNIAANQASQANGRKTPVRSSATPDRREPFRL